METGAYPSSGALSGVRAILEPNTSFMMGNSWLCAMSSWATEAKDSMGWLKDRKFAQPAGASRKELRRGLMSLTKRCCRCSHASMATQSSLSSSACTCCLISRHQSSLRTPWMWLPRKHGHEVVPILTWVFSLVIMTQHWPPRQHGHAVIPVISRAHLVVLSTTPECGQHTSMETKSYPSSTVCTIDYDCHHESLV